MAKKAKKKPTKAKAKTTATGTSQRSRPAPASLMTDVERLIRMMVDHDVSEIDVEDANRRIALKRGGDSPPPPSGPSVTAPPTPVEPSDDQDTEDDLLEIHSPMVGTFYRASSPEIAPFAQVGDHVGSDSVVCILEAMKVMNEIKAGCAGTIAEVCVEDTEPVEFGQVLFRVRTS